MQPSLLSTFTYLRSACICMSSVAVECLSCLVSPAKVKKWSVMCSGNHCCWFSAVLLSRCQDGSGTEHTAYIAGLIIHMSSLEVASEVFNLFQAILYHFLNLFYSDRNHSAVFLCVQIILSKFKNTICLIYSKGSNLQH